MTIKPVARPRPETPSTPPPPFPTVVVKIVVRDGIFYYCATDGAQSWSGAASATTREAALLDVLSEVRAALDGPIRFSVSVPPSSPFWRHADELQTALGCLVERAALADQPLAKAAIDTLTELMPAPVPVEPRKPTESRTDEQLTVATDGSVRGRHTGYGWLASDGRYRLSGSAKPGSLRRREAVLLVELNAIEDAVRSLPGHPLVVLTDSKTARTLVCAWMDGHPVNPPGFRDSALEQHPLFDMRNTIHANRDRLACQWVKGHRGDLLNEGADALARLASRYARGDSDLTPEEYDRRAAGIAESFAEESERRS
jgi:ribonuclease HI